MTELDLHLKLEKCRFAVSEVDYLGMIVKSGQLAMDPVKLDGITTWPTPAKVKDVHSFCYRPTLIFPDFSLFFLTF
jgi:hypothetical protein